MKRKINSVKKTQKITKAMKMVAAAKLKRAQQRILAFRPYGLRMRQAITDLSVRVNRTAHPLLQKRPVKNVRVSVVTSDRGLCGAFNANIFRKAFQVIEECEGRGAKVSVGVVGKKGGDFFRRRQWPIHDPFINIFERLSFEHAIEIGTAGTEAYRNGVFDEIHVVYNEFKSAVQQRVIVEQLLPIESFQETGATPAQGAYLYEPDEEELLAVLLPKWAQAQIYRILLESSAAEQAARMSAMDGATRNAHSLPGTHLDGFAIYRPCKHPLDSIQRFLVSIIFVGGRD